MEAAYRIRHPPLARKRSHILLGVPNVMRSMIYISNAVHDINQCFNSTGPRYSNSCR